MYNKKHQWYAQILKGFCGALRTPGDGYQVMLDGHLETQQSWLNTVLTQEYWRGSFKFGNSSTTSKNWDWSCLRSVWWVFAVCWWFDYNSLIEHDQWGGFVVCQLKSESLSVLLKPVEQGLLNILFCLFTYHRWIIATQDVWKMWIEGGQLLPVRLRT